VTAGLTMMHWDYRIPKVLPRENQNRTIDGVVPEIKAEGAPKAQPIWAGVALLVLFTGACTIFALVVTASQAWQEHAQARWPEEMGRIEKCGLERTGFNRRQLYHIRCRLSFSAGFEQNVATICSASVPSANVWQYPPNQIGPFEQWVDEHPPGTPIHLRYDPDLRTKAVLTTDYMPRGGPQTPNNLKLLGICGVSFVVLLTIARVHGSKNHRKADVVRNS
jgi:hypothetical protein